VVVRINRLAQVLRGAGGLVAWVRPLPWRPCDLVDAVLGSGPASNYSAALEATDPRSAWLPGLAMQADDIRATKHGYSAFFPGACDLAEQLAPHGIDTVLIAGAVANVCCEASARDAYARGFRAIMLADAMLGNKRELRAALAAIYRNFGDVRVADEIIALLAGAIDQSTGLPASSSARALR
jgi:nicotinamidase-related amidase